VTRWLALHLLWSRTPPATSSQSTERIDGIVALIMAVGRAMLVREQPNLSGCENRGMLIL
jgi:hypothetical protein